VESRVFYFLCCISQLSSEWFLSLPPHIQTDTQTESSSTQSLSLQFNSKGRLSLYSSLISFGLNTSTYFLAYKKSFVWIFQYGIHLDILKNVISSAWNWQKKKQRDGMKYAIDITGKAFLEATPRCFVERYTHLGENSSIHIQKRRVSFYLPNGCHSQKTVILTLKRVRTSNFTSHFLHSQNHRSCKHLVRKVSLSKGKRTRITSWKKCTGYNGERSNN